MNWDKLWQVMQIIAKLASTVSVLNFPHLEDLSNMVVAWSELLGLDALVHPLQHLSLNIIPVINTWKYSINQSYSSI